MMSRRLICCVAAFFFFTACKKDDDKSTTVLYQVVAMNSSKIDITYNNVLGNKIVTSAQNNWTLDIPNPSSKPFTAYIQAASTSPFSSVKTACTVNIIVNGAVVKTVADSSNTVAVVTAEYVVQ